MATVQENASAQESPEFEWGRRIGKGGVNKDVQFYESFTFDGVEYCLNDCVYMWRSDHYELDIGKLVKVWETASHKRKVKTVWFLRPNDIKYWLGDVKPLENELFLASGEGVGVSNINPLETICGKCKIVCTSDDRRNMQVSEEELKIADYTFFRTFDVGNYKISDKFTDLIAGHQVENFFNKKIDQKLKRLHVKAHMNQEARKVVIPARAVNDNDCNRTASVKQLEKAASLAEKEQFIDKNTTLRPKTILKTAGNGSTKTSLCQPPAKRKVRYLEDLPHANEPDISPYKKRLPLKNPATSGSANCAGLLPNLPDHIQNLLNSKHPYTDKRGLSSGELNNKKAKANLDSRADQSKHQKELRTLCQTIEVSRRPDMVKESVKWFKQKSWQESLERAHERNCVILLENLEPSYTSQDVEDIIWHAFQEFVSAKMIQRNRFCSPHNGRALIIFKSKDVADFVLSELNNRCLMLDDQRPVLARRRNLRHPDNPPNFFGHLHINRPKYQKQRDAQNAVSTSHYAQQNTAEYELALHWWMLQRKSTLVWDALHKRQAKEIEVHVSKLKTHNTN